MLVIISYDEAIKEIDIVDFPDCTISHLEMIQADFFKWLFDKENNHKYWIIENDEKIGCSYDSLTFIEWFNETHSQCEDAKIVEKYAKNPNITMPVLFF